MKKADKVLKIYELIIETYDQALPTLLESVDDLETTKKLIKKLATQVAPSSTNYELHFSDLFMSDLTKEHIKQASCAAFKIAHKHIGKKEQGIEEYKTDFREAYDAALRIELYRSFFSYRYFTSARGKYCKIHHTDTAPPEELIPFFVRELSKKIDSEFKKFEKRQDSFIETDSKKIVAEMRLQLNVLLSDFKNTTSVILSGDEPKNELVDAIQNAALNFEINAGQLIRSYQLKTESNSSLKPFLKNILLLITGIGTIPAIVSLLHKAATGRYAFFDLPELRETTDEEMAPEDKLLGKPNTN